MWDALQAWKKRPHHPLVISGLRQTGKTFLVRAFGRNSYRNVVYLDLRANRSIHSAFDGDFNVNDMVLAITANMPGARFVPGETLLILDEIQDCPNARSSLKYWDLDGRFDVIATGSFLGVKGFREPYMRGVPVGYEEHLEMRPLDFGEFLDNMGMNPDVVAHVRTALAEHTPVQQTVHRSLRSLYLQYLVVGGMPEAVTTFFASHDLNAVARVQRRILTSIRDDFGRYRTTGGEDRVNETLKLRAEACLDSLPAQLAKDYKKFQYSLVDVRGHSTDKADGLHYLVDIGLALKSHNLREMTAPLQGAKIPDQFKVFFADTGLLVSQLEQGTAARVLSGDLSAYKGAIAENAVAVALTAQNTDLYYFRGPSGSPELDFVFSNDGEPTIIECKSTNGRATSMNYVLAHPNKYGSHPAIKLADTNVGSGNGFVTYPLYALGFMPFHDNADLVPPVDLSGLAAELGCEPTGGTQGGA